MNLQFNSQAQLIDGELYLIWVVLRLVFTMQHLLVAIKKWGSVSTAIGINDEPINTNVTSTLIFASNYQQSWQHKKHLSTVDLIVIFVSGRTHPNTKSNPGCCWNCNGAGARGYLPVPIRKSQGHPTGPGIRTESQVAERFRCWLYQWKGEFVYSENIECDERFTDGCCG